ncbi:MAG: GRP family sugar transporter, partial [Treponema sp.]
MLTGLSFGVGSLFLILSIANLGLAISFSLSQTGAIISTLGPVLLLGEKKTKKELVFSMVGCVLIMIGGVLLGRIKY